MEERSLALVEAVDLGHGFLELRNTTGALVFLDTLGCCAIEGEGVFLLLSGISITDSSTEEVPVFLVWEVDVIVSVRVAVLGWVPSVILVPGVRS